MSQEKKDERIARYFAMAPPFLGAPETAMSPLGMDPSFGKRLTFVELGITGKMYKQTIANFPSIFQLMISRFFRVHADSEFMRVILERVAHEDKGESTTEENFLNDFFPDAKKTCNPGFVNRGKFCKTLIEPLWKVGEVDGFSITPDTMSDLFKVFSYNPNAAKIFEWAQDERFDQMYNTGVQTNIIYSTHMQNKNKVSYKEDPRTKTSFGEYY